MGQSEATPPPKEKPEGFAFVFPLSGRLAGTFIATPLLLILIYFVAPTKYQSAPFLSAFFVMPLALSWWREEEGDMGLSDFGYLICAMYGLANLALGLTMAVDSFFHASEAVEWLRQTLASGRLSFFISVTMFGATLTYRAYARRIASASVAQYILFSFALMILGFAYLGDELPPLTSVLSWSVFFIIGDWGMIDTYVVEGKQRLSTAHFARVFATNIIILVSTVVVLSGIWSTAWAFWYWVGVAQWSLGAFVLWVFSTASLNELMTGEKLMETVSPPAE